MRGSRQMGKGTGVKGADPRGTSTLQEESFMRKLVLAEGINISVQEGSTREGRHGKDVARGWQEEVSSGEEKRQQI